MTTTTAHTLIIERILPAPPETVFEAISTYDGLKQWMGPGPCFVDEGEVDLRVGGSYRLQMQTDDGAVTVTGTFLEVTPPTKLSYSWRWLHESEEAFKDSVVLMSLAGDGEGTKLTLVHQGLPSSDSKDHHQEGWIGCLNKLHNLHG